MKLGRASGNPLPVGVHAQAGSVAKIQTYHSVVSLIELTLGPAGRGGSIFYLVLYHGWTQVQVGGCSIIPTQAHPTAAAAETLNLPITEANAESPVGDHHLGRPNNHKVTHLL